MSLEISVEKIRQSNIMIATPCYGGAATSTYMRSLLALQKMFCEQGIRHAIQFIYNESLISRARNTLADIFLQGDFTHLFFIDSDIEFDPVDVLALLHFDKDIIGAAYPLKSIRWDYIEQALKTNPNLKAEHLPSIGVRYSAHFDNDTVTADLTKVEPLEVAEIATGFMLIKREVFEKMLPVRPSYATAKEGERDQMTRDRVTDFFPVGVHNDRYESEDYSFCRIWKELGGTVWLCPWMKLNHMGAFNFAGNPIIPMTGTGEFH